MKRTTPQSNALDAFLLLLFAVSLYILVFQGFGFPSINGFWHLILRVSAAASAQVFFCRRGLPTLLRLLPLLATGCFALWSVWLFCTAWEHTSFSALFRDFLSPFVSCGVILFLFRMLSTRRRDPHEKK